MNVAANTFTEALLVDEQAKHVLVGGGSDLDAARTWKYVMGSMLDTPLKLAIPGCGMKEIMASLTPDGRIVQVLPDLAGVFGPNASRDYPGYPKDEDALRLQCTRDVNTPAKQRVNNPN
jgi:hypothetical protein